MLALARPKQDVVLSARDLVSSRHVRAAREAACMTITIVVVVIMMMMMMTTQYVLAANACAGIR
jgi:hypothetical protein